MEAVISEKTSAIDVRRENLLETFNSYLRREVDGKPKRILSVGCSFGYEAQPILEIFPTAIYQGIDKNKGPISVARNENRDLRNSTFQVGDATRRETYGEEPWDIVLIRHPQVCGETLPEDPRQNVARNWKVIMENSMEALRKGGSLFVSMISDAERDMVLKYINSFEGRMKIKVNCANKFYSGRAFNDALIIVANKEG